MNRQISYNWLKEYVNIGKSAEDFAKEFSLKSMSVERIINLSQGLEGVVVGKILEIKKHPNADKLSVAQIDIGKVKPLQLIFGQMVKLNIGDQLPIAVAPTKLPTGKEIKKANIRGVNSEGMCCLDSELGIAEYDRVTTFSQKVKPGTALTKALPLNDKILDIEITTNRPDAMSVIGLAREAAAVFSTKTKVKSSAKPKIGAKKIPLAVKVSETKLCQRYQAVVMTDIKVGPSPLWLQLRLLQAGIRPINNLVDITNYVLLEYGQPMHVFDYQKISGKKIIVRRAKKGERILALDGKTYQLQPEMLVIADAVKPVAIAGVMGGRDFAATEKTSTIIFEAANFNPVSIRKTARTLNLHSESSDLFEKGLPRQLTSEAITRAIELTQKLAGGKVASKILDSNRGKFKLNIISFDLNNISRYLGIEISAAKVKKILTSLGFKVSGRNSLKIIVPWWRDLDIEGEHDIIEEVARIYGYHNLPTELPEGKIPVASPNPQFYWENKIKELLVGLGFTEVYNYSMTSPSLLKKAGLYSGSELIIANPLNETMSCLRTTLAPQIIQNISDNYNNFSEQFIFELSNVYIAKKENVLPDESLRLTGAVLAEQPFYQVKGVVEFLLKKLNINNYKLTPMEPSTPLWAPGQARSVTYSQQVLGTFGLVKQDVLNHFDLKKPLALFGFDFLALVACASLVKAYQPIPEFPGIERDLAIVIDEKLPWQSIVEAVSLVDPLIVDVRYLSTFTNQAVGFGKKSLAFRIIFRAANRTLRSEEVDGIIRKIIQNLEKDFSARRR